MTPRLDSFRRALHLLLVLALLAPSASFAAVSAAAEQAVAADEMHFHDGGPCDCCDDDCAPADCARACASAVIAWSVEVVELPTAAGAAAFRAFAHPDPSPDRLLRPPVVRA
jgi:hypothetical protein